MFKTKIKNLFISSLLVFAFLFCGLGFFTLRQQKAHAEETPTAVGTWEELYEAVKSDKTSIQLTANIENIVPEEVVPTTHRLVFDGGKNYVLDLNGYELEVLNHINPYYNADFSMIEVSKGSKLAIKNGDVAFDNYYAKSNRQARGVVSVKDTSELTATDVNMKNTYSGTVVHATASAKVTLDGGEYTVQNGFALYLERQASLTLDGDIYVHTIVGDSTSTAYVDGYGALYSESTGTLTINNALFKSGLQVHSSQIGALSIATHEVTINGNVLTEDIFDGTQYEATQQGKEYYWYNWTQKALYKTDNASFSNTVRVISYEKRYPVEVQNGVATIGGNSVSEVGYGQTVTITADTPEQGMEFIRWDTNGVVLNDYYSPTTTFTMPANPVSIEACYGKESVKSIGATVGTLVAGQKAYDTEITLANGVILAGVEWREESYKMDEDDLFKPGKTYEVIMLLYPPDECKFDDIVTATVNGNNATVSSNSQYAYLYYTFDMLPSVGFSIVYDYNSRLGIGGEIMLDTALMADQSAEFKAALDAGQVTYQWYRNGEAIEDATEPIYYLTAEDADGRFYVVVTANGKTNYGHHVNCGSTLYQLYLNASEIIAGERAPLMSSATPGISIQSDSLYIAEILGNNSYGIAQSVADTVLIPGKSYRLVGFILEQEGVYVSYGANVYVNGELLTEKLDGIGKFYYDFEVPAADYSVYYKTNGEIGIGVTLTVDVEKMCNESGTFKNAYDKANPTYQTVFYQWYKNGKLIEGATDIAYTVTTADKDSLINCKVTLVDGKFGVGEQYEISNVITVITVKMPMPQDGQTRINEDISADGVDLVGIMWWPQETGATMSGSDTYTEGTVYEYYIQFQAKDGFLLDFNGEMTIAYIYGTQAISAGSVPNEGKAYYMGEVTAIHKHIQRDTLAYNEEYHWHPCMVAGCPVPNEVDGYEAHTGGEATCQSAGVCSVCGYAYLEKVAHNYDTAWKNDETEHWNECACGEKANTAAHVDEDGDGKCDVCAYEEPVTAPEDETPTAPVNTDKDGLSGGAIAGIIIGSVAGVAVIGVGGFALVWFVIKKKTWAEFLAIFKKK